MEVIYIDRLFAVNLVIDYLILLVTARICGIYLRRLRYLLGAIFGALYAALSVVPEFEFLSAVPLKLAAGVLMSLIAYAREERFLRVTFVFFGVSALFGGAVWAVSLKSGGSLGALPYVPVSLPVLAVSFGVSYAIVSVIFRRSVKNAQKTVSDVCITHRGHSVRLRALSDSGNGLFDAVTGSRVLVVFADRLRDIFGADTDKLRVSAADAVTDPAFEGKLRLIPYSAVGTVSGLLPAFRPDAVLIGGKKRDDIIVAVSPTDVSGDGFDCVI